MTPFPNATVLAAVQCCFRPYERHLSAPDTDSLLAMLQSFHGLDDKLRSKVGVNFFGSATFAALKALWILFHHEEELIHRVRTPFLRGCRSSPAVASMAMGVAPGPRPPAYPDC